MKRTLAINATMSNLLKVLLCATILLSSSMAWGGMKGKKKPKAPKPAAAAVEAKADPGEGSDPAPGQAKEGVVNVNTATESELCHLPGIGPKKAAAIISARQQKPFKSPKDLLRVKGIGRKSLKKLLPYVTVSGQTTLKSKVTGKQ